MEKRKLGFWEIWNMSFGFMGIQFGWALQMANMSPIYEYLGAKPEEIPMLWLAAPLTGLVVQPIIGAWSDRTWTSLGRRKPFFLVGAILSSIALVFMPNSTALWMAAGLLWILDASINVSMEPFRAFVVDMLPEKQQSKGFAMQSFMIGVGAVIASALPWLLGNVFGVVNDSEAGGIPDTVKWSFYLGAVAFLGAVIWTVIKTKPYPPSSEELALMKERRGMREVLAEVAHGIANMPVTMRRVALVQFFTWPGLFLMWFYYSSSVSVDIFDANPPTSSFVESWEEGDIADRAKAYVFQDQAYLPLMEGSILEKNSKEFLDATKWFAIPKIGGWEEGVQYQMDIRVYFNDTLWTFQGPEANNQQNEIPSSKNDSWEVSQYSSETYTDGVEFAGLTLAFYNLVTFLFALLLPRLVNALGKRITHLLCLSCGGVGLISVAFVSEPNMLFVSMTGVGIAWASILSMPYAMLAPSLPAKKVGLYMGIFNFFIVLPEILASLGFGWMMEHMLDGNRMYAVVIGGGLMLLAGLLTLRVSPKVDVELT